MSEINIEILPGKESKPLFDNEEAYQKFRQDYINKMNPKPGPPRDKQVVGSVAIECLDPRTLARIKRSKFHRACVEKPQETK